MAARFVDTRCNVVGSPTPSPGCDVADLSVLDRWLTGAPVTVGIDCPAYQP